MSFLAIPFPAIDPVAVAIPLPFVDIELGIRWYSLAYIAGLLLGWRYILWTTKLQQRPLSKDEVGDFFVWCVIGVILGGRLGHVVFYETLYYLEDPIRIVKIWEGGMAFHGGLLGVAAAIILFARRRGIPMLALGDMVAAAAPIGIFFGRIANFINGELWGRPSDVPWAMAFPRAGPEPRHPSQLYEAAIEGLLLFLFLMWLCRATKALDTPGKICGTFLIFYGVGRFIVEFFRESEAKFIYFDLVTHGQLLNMAMILPGLFLIWLATRNARKDAA